MSKNKYILIRTDNTFEIVEIDKDNFLNEAHRLLDCSFIDIVNPGKNNIRFCIDDTGKLTGKELNILATVIYNFVEKKYFDTIVGNILVGADEVVNELGEHDFVGLSDNVAQKYYLMLADISVNLFD